MENENFHLAVKYTWGVQICTPLCRKVVKHNGDLETNFYMLLISVIEISCCNFIKISTNEKIKIYLTLLCKNSG